MTSSLISKVDLSGDHKFLEPVKRIHDGPDVTFFLTSMAYKDITQFILQLNRAMIPRKGLGDDENHARSWPLTNDETKFPPSVQRLRTLLSAVDALIAEAPPDPGPRRFGNASFRTWYGLVEKQVGSLLHDRLSADVLQAQVEIQAYFLGSFGSPQRLDYGTGHELSFLAFLGCLWKLSYFNDAEASVEERAIVLGVFEPYLRLIRKLIKTYNLEPAGSHGVWGLDDNSFLPYIFGSAQLAPAIAESDITPTQGSMTNAPDPSSIVKANLVDKEKDHNMYFSAIAFINDVKRGPFWEHSPMLFDISGIKDGWGKINKGMLKMYNAEVLSKFPVVQHFPFGSLFRWEKDPEAREISATTHTASQPLRNPIDASAPAQNRPMGPPSTAAPWAGATRAPPRGFVNGVTQAPWANRSPAPLAPSPASSLRAVPPTIKPQATNKPALPGTPENP